MIVVLPEPLGPSNPMISPFSTLNETWLTARVGAEIFGKVLDLYH